MPQHSDPKNLLTDQYRDSSNLNARIQLHACFSTNNYDWQLWVLDQFDIPSESLILELGCGPGTLWSRNGSRIPDSWYIILSDFSLGMLRNAEQKLCEIQHSFKFVELDAQMIPFANDSFDAVVANHMLYHVRNKSAAISEVCRVLKPGGKFYAATNGQNHMRELREMMAQFDPNILPSISDRSFTLDNGLDQLSEYFSYIELKRYEDSLAITEVKPLVAYVASMNSSGTLRNKNKLLEFSRFIEQKMASDGVINISKDAGMFIALRVN